MARGEDKYGNYYDSINGQIISRAQTLGRTPIITEGEKLWYKTYCEARRDQDQMKAKIDNGP